MCSLTLDSVRLNDPRLCLCVASCPSGYDMSVQSALEPLPGLERIHLRHQDIEELMDGGRSVCGSVELILAGNELRFFASGRVQARFTMDRIWDIWAEAEGERQENALFACAS